MAPCNRGQYVVRELLLLLLLLLSLGSELCRGSGISSLKQIDIKKYRPADASDARKH